MTRMAELAAAGASFLAIFIFILITYIVKSVLARKSTQPPVISGWVPWIGCAIEFGKAPLEFIRRARDEHGSVFTFHAAGQRMTFLTDPKDFDIFFNSSEASFPHAVQDPCRNTANISAAEFFKYHRVIHDLVKWRLAPRNLHKMTPRVCQYLEPVITKYDPADMKMDLNDLVRDVLYSTIVPVLFGDDSLPKTQAGFTEFKENFVKYDGSFEHGAKLPDFLLTEWSKCKQHFLQKFEELCMNRKNLEPEDTILQAILDTIEEETCSPKYAVLFLWASLANAVPITFWTLVFILSHKTIHDQLLKQLKEAFDEGTHDEGPHCKMTIEDLKKVPLLEYCVLEAIRLRSPGIIARKVIKPINVYKYTIPVGDLLMVSPYWTHHDNSVFPDAENFQPYRWQDRAEFADKLIAFGGGRYQCPGRWFAMMEIQIFISVLLYNFNIRLAGLVPEPSPLHAVGVPQPAEYCSVTISRRKHWNKFYMTTV